MDDQGWRLGPQLAGLEISDSIADDVHDRDTLPVPEPALAGLARGDDAPLGLQAPSPEASDPHRTPTVRPSLPQTAGALEEEVGDEDETRKVLLMRQVREDERPIPAAPLPAEYSAEAAQAVMQTDRVSSQRSGAQEIASRRASATTARASQRPTARPIDRTSSLAPAERAAEAPRNESSRWAAALIAVAVVLGTGAGWLVAGPRLRSGSRTSAARGERSAAVESGTIPTPVRVSALSTKRAEPQPAKAVVSGPVSPLAEERTPPLPAVPKLDPPARAKKSPVATVVPEQPETPSREDVVRALQPLRAALQACAAGRSGVAELDLTIASSGAVAQAVVGGDFRGGPEGSCIARTIRAARLPAFKQPRFRILYPFSL